MRSAELLGRSTRRQGLEGARPRGRSPHRGFQGVVPLGDMTRRPGAIAQGRLRVSCPQKDSNLRTWLRRPVLYPLSYGGSPTQKGYQSATALVTCERHNIVHLGRDAVKGGGNLTDCDARFG